MNDQTECPICNSSDIHVIMEYNFKKPPEEEYWKNATFQERRLWILFNKIISNVNHCLFQLSHCRNCDFLYLNPRLSDEEIKIKYQTLNELNSTSTEYLKNPMYYVDERAKRIFNLLSAFITPSIEKKTVLDYGGQFGHNLKCFMKEKFNKSIVDFEHYDLYDDVIYKGSEIDNIEDKSCCAILANHIFEHINYPRVILENLVRKLDDDGIIYLEVPCGVFKEAYHIKEPITHLNYFSEKSLFNLLASVGLSVIHLDTTYQWITFDKEWCVNIVGRKKRIMSHELRGEPRDMRRTKHQPLKYVPIVFEKLRVYSPLKHLVKP